MDTHHPYKPPPPFDTHFSDEGSLDDAGRLFRKTADLVREDPPLNLSPDELERLTNYYDGTIRFADREIGRLIEQIRALPDDRETIVLITSDHGDEFLEHGSLYHTNLLIEELIHVPLIVWSSMGTLAQKPIDELTRHIDIMPTLIDLAGLGIPETVSGRSLAPLMRGETSKHDVVSIAEGDFCTSLNYKNWKIMHVDSTESYQLFDLTHDPEERQDVSLLHPNVMAKLKARLDDYRLSVADIDGETEETADDETIRQLRALGYIH